MWYGKMSKSIYDEALQEIRKVWNGNPLTYPKKTIKALERAKKQEKLLELYREKDKYTTLFIPLPRVELCKYRSIVKQIKELENE